LISEILLYFLNKLQRMHETKCDVLIVGAGPAGCSAAFFSKLLDKNNSHEIILLERFDNGHYDRYHTMCGEGVSSELFRDIAPIKPSCIVEKIEKIREYWPEKVELETTMNGYIIDRPTFLNGIIDRFVTLGGRFIRKPLHDFIQRDKEITVKMTTGESITTRYLIAADGPNSFIRKKLGIAGRVKTLVQYVVEQEPEHNTLIFEYDECWEGDYKWIFPHGATTKVGFPFQKHQVREPFEGAILTKQARKVAFGGLENTVYGNILLVGDAACQSNPLTKGGIRPGMVAGRMAAEALLTNNPRAYAEKWKRSAFASPLFLHAFDRLRGMNNKELARHMAPFRKGFNAFSGIKAALLYPEYLKLYKAYDLSYKVGW
jgi:digeranylgeranylglycerophospholipid reductase